MQQTPNTFIYHYPFITILVIVTIINIEIKLNIFDSTKYLLMYEKEINHYFFQQAFPKETNV